MAWESILEKHPEHTGLIGMIAIDPEILNWRWRTCLRGCYRFLCGSAARCISRPKHLMHG